MTEMEKMNEIRNSSEYASKMTDKMVVRYNNDGVVIAEHNAEECPGYNPNEETYMVQYQYSGLTNKVCKADVIVRILTEMKDIKKAFSKWLQRPDKTDENCPVTYADVFIKKLFPYDWDEVIEGDYYVDDYAEDEDYNDEEEVVDTYPAISINLVRGAIALCFAGIIGTIRAIDRELSRRNW